MITEVRKLDFSHPMKENAYVLADCMEVMKAMPDNYIDLCLVDPVYGGVTQGGYMKEQGGKRVGHELADRRIYHQSIWAQDKTPKEYFDELFRVSKAQIIWGGTTSPQVLIRILRVGLYGIRSGVRVLVLPMVNLLGPHLTKH